MEEFVPFLYLWLIRELAMANGQGMFDELAKGKCGGVALCACASAAQKRIRKRGWIMDKISSVRMISILDSNFCGRNFMAGGSR